MLGKTVNNQKIQFSKFNITAKPGSDNEESDNSGKEEGNRKNYDMTHQEKYKCSKKALHWTP